MNNKHEETKYEPTEVPSFNDVTDHYQKHIGVPNKRVNLNTVPRWLRIFWYGIMGFVVMGFVFLVVALMIK